MVAKMNELAPFGHQ